MDNLTGVKVKFNGQGIVTPPELKETEKEGDEDGSTSLQD